MSTSYLEFLTSRIEAGGFTTEDALASFLPLAREVLDAHAAGLAAPLEGIGALLVDGAKIYFPEARRQPLRRAGERVDQAQGVDRGGVHVVSETRRTTDVDDGQERVVDLAVAAADDRVNRPVFLPEYICWEHRLDCHDPLTDIFSLGMILASLACGLDFHDPDAVRMFAAQRRNLFTIAPDLHPVVARGILRMTELHRGRRVQDLASLIHSLENYRDQEVELDFELASSQEFVASPAHDRKTLILSKLRERLFEVSRRNKLLHFRTTMQSVNLTHASVPLSFDVKNVGPDQLFVWNNDLQQQLVTGKPLSL
ncbi:hypothetical protein OAS39_06445, partial [Pirellulales bacterium]|nr:hypothetical protein [Pirellulales bacterium]